MNLKDWILKVLYEKIPLDFNIIYNKTLPNLLSIIDDILQYFVNLKYKTLQCAEEYQKLNNIKNQYNVIVSREYDLIYYNLSRSRIKKKMVKILKSTLGQGIQNII